MNIRKTIGYSAMYTKLDELMEQSLPQMEFYREIGKLICSRPEKGAAIMASEYLRKSYPNAVGFSPRNVRRMRKFIHTYESNEALIAETMKIGWTQNILIMERCADDAERQWYLRAVFRFGWPKLELAAKLDDGIQLNMSFAPQEEKCDTESRGTGKENDSESPHKFAAVPSVRFRESVAEESSARAKARGQPSRYRCNFTKIAPRAQKLTMSKAAIAALTC